MVQGLWVGHDLSVDVVLLKRYTPKQDLFLQSISGTMVSPLGNQTSRVQDLQTTVKGLRSRA